jgi:Tol biopolymer transport system component
VPRLGAAHGWDLGPEGVLRRVALAVLPLLALSVRAQDDDALDALRRPERLTVAIRDQFLGQLSPDEKTLYFVSNQDTRKEIYAQDEDGRAHRVFDEAADVTWPRVSPDGKRLLYISFANEASGRLCVRTLPDGEHRRCLEDAPATLQAEWIDDKHIALVERMSIDGNLRVSELDAELKRRVLSEHNWIHPAISPDGRWLVHVPVDRTDTHVGPGFAARTLGRLEVLPLAGGQSVPVPIDLPGISGQPAFSRDGRSLYFVQFFSDSNHDGQVDASDHGVLFRVPFADGKAGEAAPLQLTDSSWNCQYPAPAAHKLIATCSRGRDLDVYELPLDGQVPSSWTRERLRLELGLGGRREEVLLLYRQALLRAPDPLKRRLIAMRLVMAHLELEEFDAAAFYAEKVAALRLPESLGIEQPLRLWVEHRRARADRERGRMLDSYADDARARLERLADARQDSSAARVLGRVVASEIRGALGDEAGARRELESARLEGDLPRSVLEAYYERADGLYRTLDERAPLIALARRLAAREGLPEDVQLDYARAAARAVVRGLPRAEALAAVERERATARDELAFALDAMREVLTIEAGEPAPGVRERMLALYDAQPRPDRKRALVLQAVKQAAELGADWVIECLAERYLQDVPLGTEERRRAERLYKRALMGRAFRHLADGRSEEARLDFDAVYRETEALEALVESVSLRIANKTTALENIEAEVAPGSGPHSPTARFAHAYVIARQLPTLHGEAHARAFADARQALREAWPALKSKAPARVLAASLEHEKFLRDNDFAAAEAANAQYIVALQLAQYDPRYQATIQGALGMLHTRVGNYRIALDYIAQRERFPLGDDRNGLALRLAAARARLHVGEDDGSARAAEDALAMVERTPGLARYRMIALDRAALGNLACGHFARALALYDAELPLLTGGARRNPFVVRLARAAAALGAELPERALSDLDVLEPQLDDDDALIAALSPPHVSKALARRSYGTIVSGLRANANRSLGKLDAVARALERRRELYRKRYESSQREEDVRAVALVEARLAANALARGDRQSASRWIVHALTSSDTLAMRVATPVDDDSLHVLAFAAELATVHDVVLPSSLSARLRAGEERIRAEKSSAHRSYQRRFEIYQTLLSD